MKNVERKKPRIIGAFKLIFNKVQQGEVTKENSIIANKPKL